MNNNQRGKSSPLQQLLSSYQYQDIKIPEDNLIKGSLSLRKCRRLTLLFGYTLLVPADNPQEQGITVVPLNVEVGYRSAGARRKSYLFPTTKVSQVLVDYALK